MPSYLSLLEALAARSFPPGCDAGIHLSMVEPPEPHPVELRGRRAHGRGSLSPGLLLLTERWAVGEGEMGSGVRRAQRPAGHMPSPSPRREGGGRRRPQEQDTGRPVPGKRDVREPGWKAAETPGPRAGAPQPESVPATSPGVDGVTAKCTRPAAGPVERVRRAGAASDSGRPVLGVWTLGDMGSCGGRGPLSRGGEQPLREKNIPEIQLGRVGTRAPASHVCLPLLSAPRASVTPHKETPTYY